MTDETARDLAEAIDCLTLAQQKIQDLEDRTELRERQDILELVLEAKKDCIRALRIEGTKEQQHKSLTLFLGA